MGKSEASSGHAKGRARTTPRDRNLEHLSTSHHRKGFHQGERVGGRSRQVGEGVEEVGTAGVPVRGKEGRPAVAAGASLMTWTAGLFKSGP